MWLFLFLVYLLIYGFNLWNPGNIYYDEYYTVTTARQILHLSGYMSDHPPLGMLLMALSMALGGDHPWVWRLSSLLAGFGCIVLTFLITRRMTGCLRTAGLAAVLFALDGLTVVLSRVAMLNSVMLFFMLFSIHLLLLWADEYRRKFLFFSALCLGFSIATHWLAVVTLIPWGIIFMQTCRQNHMSMFGMTRDLSFALVVCLAVYFSTFAFFPFLPGSDWQAIFEFQSRNFRVLSMIPDLEPSPFWQWPLLVKPVILCAGGKNFWPGQPVYRQVPVHVIMALGNPAIVWPGCVALSGLLIKLVKKMQWRDGFILFCFLAFWMIPGAFMSRQKFSYYFYPAMPFLCMALSVVINDMVKAANIKKVLAYVYLGLVVGMFVYWYPLWTHMPVGEAFYRSHLWLKSWPSIL